MTRFFDFKQYIFIILSLVFASPFVIGQTTNTEYFMQTSTSKRYLNPAKTPERGFIGIPFFTNFTVGYRTNTFGLDNFLFPNLGENGKLAWFLNKNVSYNRFMKGISNQNYLDFDAYYSPIAMGFRIGEGFLTLDAGIKSETQINLPGSLFKFLKRGITLDGDHGQTYDFSNISLTTHDYLEIGLGGSIPFLDNSLVVGAKVKYLIGGHAFQFRVDKMLLAVEKYRWTLTTQASLKEFDVPVELKDDDIEVGDFEIRPNGSGYGMDLGVTYTHPNTGLTLSAALVDVGTIRWNDKSAIFYTTGLHENTITGDYDISYEEGLDGSLSGIIEDLGDSFYDAIALEENPDANLKKTTSLRSKLNLSLEYRLPNDQINLGLLSTSCHGDMETVTEYTVAGAYRPKRWLELGLSYSFVHSRFDTFGFSLHIGPGLFIASDYIVSHYNQNRLPTSTRAANFQFGWSIRL
jgi:hypothetical protein